MTLGTRPPSYAAMPFMVPFTVHPYREWRLTVRQVAVRVRPAGVQASTCPRQLNKGESMDWKPFDRARATVGPEELDLIESYSQGRINRRDFVRRGTVIGLSVPFLGAVIAACGGDDDEASTDTDADGGTDTTPGTEPAGGDGTTARTPGGIIRVASQKPAGPLDPIGMQDLGSYGIVAQCFEFLATLGESDIAPGLAESWEPNEDGSVWTFNLRQGVKWQDGTDFTSADVAATFDRLAAADNAGLKGVIGPGSVDATDPAVAVVTLLAPNGNFPYLVSVLQRANGHHAGRLRDRHDARRFTERHRRVEAEELRRRDRRRVRAQPRLVGGPHPHSTAACGASSTRKASMVTAASAGEVDTLVQFQVIGGDALFNDENFTVVGFQAATHRQIWMRCDQGQFADSKVRQALGMCLDRAGARRDAVQGQGRHRQRPRDRSDVPVLRPVGPPARTRHRRCQGAARRGGVPRRPVRGAALR